MFQHPAPGGPAPSAAAPGAAPALALALASTLLAGCGGPGPTYLISGVFEPDATPEDIDDLQARLAVHGATAQIMESYPLQYQIRGLNAADCADIHEVLRGLPYIDVVGECRELVASGDPDTPVTSP